MKLLSLPLTGECIQIDTGIFTYYICLKLLGRNALLSIKLAVWLTLTLSSDIIKSDNTYPQYTQQRYTSLIFTGDVEYEPSKKESDSPACISEISAHHKALPFYST